LARHLGRDATHPYRTKKRIQQKQKVKTVIKNGAQELCPEPERATAGFVRQSKIKNPKSKIPKSALFQSISKAFKEKNVHQIRKSKSLSNKSGQAQNVTYFTLFTF
jgi:hypothetical protein